MSCNVDKELIIKMRDTILKHIKEQIDSGAYKRQKPKSASYESISADMIGLHINSIKNEILNDVVICEGEEGTTAKRLIEPGYEISEVTIDWADNNWWKENGFTALGDAALAIAYDYLLQEEAIDEQKFDDENEAARIICQSLARIKTDDDFVERAMALIADYYSIADHAMQ